MNATHRLHEAGQSLWLDNITRAIVTGGLLRLKKMYDLKATKLDQTAEKK